MRAEFFLPVMETKWDESGWRVLLSYNADSEAVVLLPIQYHHVGVCISTGLLCKSETIWPVTRSFPSYMFLWSCIECKAWRKNTNKMQQYRWFIVNTRCWLLTTVSTCFGHLYAHHQENRPRVTAYGVYLLVVLDVAGCGTVVLRCRVWALWRLL